MQIVRMQWIVLVLVGAIACGKTSTEPAHAGSSGGTKPAANAEVHVPLLNREALDSEHLPPRPIFVVYQNKTFLRLPSELDLIFSPDGRPRIASDDAKESGHWIEQATQPLPSGTPTTPAELATAAVDEQSVVIFADGTTPVAELVPAMDAAFRPAKKCWWLGVKRGAVSPDGCGREDVGDDAVILTLTIGGGKGSLSISHINDTTPFASFTELDTKLGEQKASAFFADRTDIAIALTGAPTIADLVALFAEAHAIGFTSAYLAH